MTNFTMKILEISLATKLKNLKIFFCFRYHASLVEYSHESCKGECDVSRYSSQSFLYNVLLFELDNRNRRSCTRVFY